MTLTTDQIRKILPQSYPFLMIDKVIEYKENESLTAIKNVTADEWCFAGDLSETNIFPEVLILEAAAQTAIVLYHLKKSKDNPSNPLFFLGRIRAEFFHTVTIGDQLRIKSFSGKIMSNSGYANTDITMDAQKIAQVELMYGLRNK